MGSSGAQVINPIAGTVIRYSLLHLDIFWPVSSFLSSEGDKEGYNSLNVFSSKGDPNDFSIQALLSLGESDALLTGDLSPNMASEVILNIPSRSVEYIKVSHHGSKYGLTLDYLETIKPKIAVIEVGKDNSHGHPTKEI